MIHLCLQKDGSSKVIQEGTPPRSGVVYVVEATSRREATKLLHEALHWRELPDHAREVVLKNDPLTAGSLMRASLLVKELSSE